MKKIVDKISPKTIAATFTSKQVKKRCNTNLDVKLGDIVYIDKVYPGEPGTVCEIKNKLYPSCDITVLEAYTEEANNSNIQRDNLEYIYDSFGDKIYRVYRKSVERCFSVVFKENKVKANIKTDLDLFTGDLVYVDGLYPNILATIARPAMEQGDEYDVVAAFGYPVEKLTKENFNAQVNNRKLHMDLVSCNEICPKCKCQAFKAENSFRQTEYLICPNCGIVKTENLNISKCEKEVLKIRESLPISIASSNLITDFSDTQVAFKNHKLNLCNDYDTLFDLLKRSNLSSYNCIEKIGEIQSVYSFEEIIDKIFKSINVHTYLSYIDYPFIDYIKPNLRQFFGYENRIKMNCFENNIHIDLINLTNLPDILCDDFYNDSQLIIKYADNIYWLNIYRDTYDMDKMYINMNDDFMYNEVYSSKTDLIDVLDSNYFNLNDVEIGEIDLSDFYEEMEEFTVGNFHKLLAKKDQEKCRHMDNYYILAYCKEMACINRSEYNDILKKAEQGEFYFKYFYKYENKIYLMVLIAIDDISFYQ